MSEGGPAVGQESLQVAIAGIGNCASSFVQGPTHHREAGHGETVPGLMSPDPGGHRARAAACR